jgi:hypothetical protein
MSKPLNPLSRFRSYNYYHVLALCDSSQTAEMLSSDTNLNAWQHAPDDTPDNRGLGTMSVQTVNNNGINQYCILINGSTDASYSITKVSFISILATDLVDGDNGTSMVYEGTIDISEPKGILFLDKVVNCCLEMGIDSTTAVWCLKTFFVGYKDDETVEHVTTIDPIMFLAVDAMGSFTEEGGSYNIAFAALAHGASRLPQYSRSGMGQNTKLGDCLKTAVSELTNCVKSTYDAYYACIYNTISSMPQSDDIVNALRHVDYLIEVMPPYDDPSYKINDQNQQIKDGNSCDSSGIVRLDANSSIETAIHNIMSLCSKVKEEKYTGDPATKIKYDYKIHTAVESKKVSEAVTEYKVIYRVERQVVPNSLSLEDILDGKNTESLGENTIEFDYIYTGKNIDILEFDMKVNMGLSYVQAATLANSYHSSNGNPATVKTTPSNYSIGTALTRQGGKVTNIPVFFSTMIKQQLMRNTNDATATTQAAFTMSKWASLEAAESTIKIVGNLNFLNNVNRNTHSSSIKANEPNSAQSADDVMPGWGRVPSLAKVNIKMPRNNNDLALFTGSANVNDTSQDYAVNFWFDGYYYIYGAEHVFDRGEFYQILNMIAIPKNSVLKSLSEPTKDVPECFDSNIGCQQSQNKPPVAIPEKREFYQPSVIDNILNDPNTQNKLPSEMLNSIADSGQEQQLKEYLRSQMSSTADFSNIKGYNQATPEVKDAINQAIKNENLTPDQAMLLVNTISVESNFNANAKGPADPTTGNRATGLGQFFPAAWSSVGMSTSDSKADPYLNAQATARYLKLTQSQMEKRLGRPVTSAEVYAGHHYGPAGAANMIKKGDPESMAKINKDVALLNSKILKGAPYVSNTLASNASTPNNSTTNQSRTNKEAIAATKDCGVENEVSTDKTKNPCDKNGKNIG